ncbi:MAG: ABC transporter permease [Desulfobacterales bacterium]|nr:ABC transporter permease [Desulfobacterales bacterium]
MKQTWREKTAPARNSALSILLALVAGGVILVFIGKNPFVFYTQLFLQGLGGSLGAIETIIKTAPLLLVSAGLLLAFSGGLWNLGVDGQFLIGAMLAGWLAPMLAPGASPPVYLAILATAGFLGGAAWAAFPAFLKARHDLNEIITTLMMNYVALNFASWMVKGPINDLSVVPAQTPLIPMTHRMPMIPFTRVHVGLIVGALALIGIHWMIRRTTRGFELRVLLSNKMAAVHAGMPVGRITVRAMLISGGLAGMAGVCDVLAIKGLFQADWHPGYGMTCIPLVFLARLNGWAVIPLACFFSFLAVGGEFASRDQGVPIFFVHVLEGLILLFFAAGEYFENKK